ncbi:hypothetical protein M0R04_01655 [Candidatus Dojkabacteria bacterium]|jgi:tRNA pseudouridine55 synthase|nr:hypothetical protein [Candidatus Dojkabacteria bacterium]
MNPQINIYKPIGKTPLEMINLLKEKYPEYSNQKISYAGRLDPMAHGVLVLLVGEGENKKRREREKVDKEYDFKVLFGISTDSYDILGIPKLHKHIPDIAEVEGELKKLIGKYNQKIPTFSSYRIAGKPMYLSAKKGLLKEEHQPKIEREIFGLKILKNEMISNEKLLKEIKERIGKITKPDFRQNIIIPKYKKLLGVKKEFLLLTVHSHVSSGTYIRSICDDLGKALNTGACAFEILRIRSGVHNLKNSMYI